jgi:uncharacterized surface protein with fasciclin (FAS1) repeats
MKMFKTITTMSCAALLMMGCGETKKEMQNEKETAMIAVDQSATTIAETPTIVGVAAGNDNFSTLVAAVKAAELVETLNGKGPFTVFAPTNDAFAKLPDGTVATLLEPKNKSMLTGILTYHVIAGSFNATAVIDAIKANNGVFEVATVNGGKIKLSLVNGKVTLTDAKGGMATVIMADVPASNGIIHAIDTVVMP